MNVTIPIYIRKKKHRKHREWYAMRPLFMKGPEFTGENLIRMRARLINELQITFGKYVKSNNQSEIIRCSYNPSLREHKVEFDCHLKQRVIHCKVYLISIDYQRDHYVFCPELPDFWFQVERGKTIEEGAQVAFTERFKFLDREHNDELPERSFGSSGAQYVDYVKIEFDQTFQEPKEDDEKKVGLASFQVHSGFEELTRVGTCLDHLYPDELEKAILRDDEVSNLEKLIKLKDCRPILVVGPVKSGKTAIIHQAIANIIASAKKKRSKRRGNFWHLSPQRLISGMSYIGQWQARLKAITDEAQNKGHTLIFDNLLGLFSAGRSSSSSLSMADFLKPKIAKGKFRFIAEVSFEQFRVLQEKDRGFMDAFQVIRILSTTEQQTYDILTFLQQEWEDRFRCEFDPEAVPIVYELQKRYVKNSVFPGKAAGFLQMLAKKYSGKRISRETVLDEFSRMSGMSVQFLNNREKLHRQDIVNVLQKGVIGQTAACEAMADFITLARARLNDTERPLASLLFLGSTGVGKTECAKVTAEYLFGSRDRLLRFDMNEFNGADTVPRLFGSMDNADGLLTNAVYRQPFCVLLFDEIEKAHPDCLDLLLQVLGEGRLTNTRGETIDFTNAIIILTSNLGVTDVNEKVGFTEQSSIEEGETFRKAAERFFRPEFFNRLDRIIPFSKISKDDMSVIARSAINKLFKRDGFVHRRVVIDVKPCAFDWIVKEGYHPKLGARALKRSLERNISQPVGERLSSFRRENPTIITLSSPDNALSVQTQELVECDPVLVDRYEWDKCDLSSFIDNVQSYLRNEKEKLYEALGGEGLSSENVAKRKDKVFQYQAIEYLRGLEHKWELLKEDLEFSKRGVINDQSRVFNRKYRYEMDLWERKGKTNPQKRIWLDLFAAEEIQDYFRELNDGLSEYKNIDKVFQACQNELALWNSVSEDTFWGKVSKTFVVLRSYSCQKSRVMKAFFSEFGKSGRNISVEIVEENRYPKFDGLVVEIEGPGSRTIADLFRGCWIICSYAGQMDIVEAVVVEADVVSVEEIGLNVFVNDSGDKRVNTILTETRQDLNPLLENYDGIDFRSGLYGKVTPYSYILSVLPLPAEINTTSISS